MAASNACRTDLKNTLTPILLLIFFFFNFWVLRQVGTVESDGKRSVRNLSGLRRGSEVMFMPTGSVSSNDSESTDCMWRLVCLLFVAVVVVVTSSPTLG